MIFDSFWKKIFILNIVILIVIYRIFNVLEKYLKHNSYHNSLFPIISEDGYPFFNAINCDISSMLSITKQIVNTDNFTQLSFPNNLLLSKECSFINKYNLCKDNKECLNKINRNNNIFIENNLKNLYHSELGDYKIKNFIGISSLINIINNKNEFSDRNNNKNKIEISFYHKIISGYYSFLMIKQYDNNIKKNLHMSDNDYFNYNILRQVTQDENKMNDLFYLHSLFLYSYIKINKNNKNENDTDSDDLNFIINYSNQCIELSDDWFSITKNKILTPKNLKIFEKIFLNEIMNIVDCIPDVYERNSFLVDLTAFNTMIKILSESKDLSISQFEYSSLKYFLEELCQRINDIFNAEIEVKTKVNLLKQNHIYIIIIYGCLSLAIIFFINKHFIKNKSKYENKRKRKEENDKRKYYNLSKNIEKNNNNINKYNDKDNKKQLTQEELDYIQKLAKENKGDFLITK